MAELPTDCNDEDAIWNYKLDGASKSRKKSSGQYGSKSKSFTKEKGDASSFKGELRNVIIDIDSDEDFPFTSVKPVNNEKSAAQWASMFSEKKEKNSCVNIHKDKNVARKYKRKLMPSRSPLKINTYHLQSKKQTETPNQNYPPGIKNDLTLTKTVYKKMKLSSSGEELSSSLEEKSEELLHPGIDSNNKESPLTHEKGSVSSSNASSLSFKEKSLVNQIRQDSVEQVQSDSVHTARVGDEMKPKVVDVIVLDDDCDISVADVPNETFSIDTVYVSDIDKEMETDTEAAGGFVRDDNKLDSSSHFLKTGSPQMNPSEGLTSSSPTSNDNNVIDDTPLSTAARKQISIMSFFSSKAFVSTSKTKSATDKKLNDAIKGNRNSSLNKSQTFPYAKTQGSNKEDSSSSSFVTVRRYGNYQNKGRQRQCPFYKKIPDTSFTVDAFRYGDIPECKSYFLTHFHYDHYGGLTKKFTQPIYCSKITGNLVERRLGVDKRWIRRLPMWKPVIVNDVTLTLMEANHCPGAVIVLFETKNGKKILHTGDFRASVEMEDYLALKNIVVDELYLDTTYCNPSYAFPSQKTVIDFAVSLVEKQIAINPKTLFVCGSYTIGKERIFTAIARALDSKICMMSDKKKVLDCLENEDLIKRVTLNWAEGRVHVLPMAKLKQESLFEHHARHSQYTSVLAFEPTGWTHSNKPISLGNLQPKWSKNGVTLYGVPYSEHSSYLEMKRFVQFIRPRKILPTVNNGNAACRKKMENIFEEWLSE